MPNTLQDTTKLLFATVEDHEINHDGSGYTFSNNYGETEAVDVWNKGWLAWDKHPNGKQNFLVWLPEKGTKVEDYTDVLKLQSLTSVAPALEALQACAAGSVWGTGDIFSFHPPASFANAYAHLSTAAYITHQYAGDYVLQLPNGDELAFAGIYPIKDNLRYTVVGYGPDGFYTREKVNYTGKDGHYWRLLAVEAFFAGAPIKLSIGPKLIDRAWKFYEGVAALTDHEERAAVVDQRRYENRDTTRVLKATRQIAEETKAKLATQPEVVIDAQMLIKSMAGGFFNLATAPSGVTVREFDPTLETTTGKFWQLKSKPDTDDGISDRWAAYLALKERGLTVTNQSNC